MQSPTLFCDAQAEPAAWLWFPDPEGSTTWARAAEPGATIAVMSLMGSLRLDIPDEHPAGYLLIGDAAAMASTAVPLAVLAYVATNSGWQQRRRPADPCRPAHNGSVGNPGRYVETTTDTTRVSKAGGADRAVTSIMTPNSRV